jgi:multiple sugar transport system ATP-binding protein
MIAGLEEISSGDLYIDDELVNDKAPKDRNIAMVFQSYALYPHMSVYDNMAFGLKLRKVPKNEIQEKVREAAEILGLVPYLDRKPKALSGGQRQRVALGRAIVRKPKVFLMDEPLSNLDAKLRVQMRGELIKLHNRISTTTIYVTHDQIEAMTMATRIVVMKDGYIQQVGAPKSIYDFPVNMFVAGFMGTPPMNFIRGNVDRHGIFRAGNDCEIVLPTEKFDIIKQNRFISKDVVLGIRPEDIYDDERHLNEFKDSVVRITVDVAELLGAETNIYAQVNGSNVCASVSARSGVRIGDIMDFAINPNKVHFFDPESELRLVVDDNADIPSVEDQEDVSEGVVEETVEE